MFSSETILSIAILVSAFLISVITLMTGFGIGTVLTPAFALFYDVKTAVLLVSIVHLANNLLKLGLFMKHVNKEVFLRFGLISVVGAAAGTLLQGALDARLVGYALGLFLVATGGFEFLPKNYGVKLPRSLDQAGGFFSGFMGGLIGNQGAVRSAYLLNYDLSKESFIGTATAISTVVDLTRIPLYLAQEISRLEDVALSLAPVILVAFGGTLVGARLLKKIPLERFRLIVAFFLVALGIKFFFS